MWPERMSCSASLTALSGFQVGSAPMQTPAASVNARMRKIFICLTMIGRPLQKRDLSTRGMLFHSHYYFSSGVALFELLDRVANFASRLVSAIDHRFEFSGLHHLAEDGEILS